MTSRTITRTGPSFTACLRAGAEAGLPTPGCFLPAVMVLGTRCMVYAPHQLEAESRHYVRREGQAPKARKAATIPPPPGWNL